MSVWQGQAGPVVLGPTEARVARFLEALTRHGRVQIPTARIVDDLALERSEAYRIARRLRVLGLFGIEDDRGGARGGRLWWRTRGRRDGAELDVGRHRRAWSRVVGSSRRRRDDARRRLESIRRVRNGGDTPAPVRDRRESTSIGGRLLAAGLSPELARLFGLAT